MFRHWKISRRDAVMVVVFLLACVALWFLDVLHTAPPAQGVKCRARVLSVDNTNILQFGLLKKGA